MVDFSMCGIYMYDVPVCIEREVGKSEQDEWKGVNDSLVHLTNLSKVN